MNIHREDILGALSVLRSGSAKATLAKTMQILLNLPQTAMTVPRGRFEAEKAGMPPDFDELDSWVAHPSRVAGTQDVEDANHLAPAAAPLPPVGERPCDCFFVVDSCYTAAEATPFLPQKDSRRWNLPMGARSEETDAQMLVAKVMEQMRMRTAAGASAFNRTCRIFAPAYRQVPVMSLAYMPFVARQRGQPSKCQSALEVAYEDVRRAFVRFVDDPENADRPFILAGHSQGTLHLVRLLQEEVEPNPGRLRRFVHAYLAGYGVPLDLFSTNLRNIRPSSNGSDLRTVSSWRTAATYHPSHDLFKPAAFYSGAGWQGIEGDLLATNPVSWSAGHDSAPSSPGDFKGALWPMPSNLDPRESDGLLPSGVSLRFGHKTASTKAPLGVRISSLVPVDCGQITARVDRDGFVRVPHFHSDSLFSLTERDWLLYHDLDCALFHNNLQENVAVRVRQWQRPRSRL